MEYPSKPGKSNFFCGISRGFCWDIPAVPEKFEKKEVCVRFLASMFTFQKLTSPDCLPPATCSFFHETLVKCLASRKRCDLKTRKRCDFCSAAQKIASDFSAIFWRFFCDFCGKTCDLVLCDLKTQRFFCDCDFLGR